MVEPGVALTELLTPDAKVPPYAIYLTVTVDAAGVAVALLSLLVVEAVAATGAAVASVVAEGALPVVVPAEAELPSELSVARLCRGRAGGVCRLGGARRFARRAGLGSVLRRGHGRGAFCSGRVRDGGRGHHRCHKRQGNGAREYGRAPPVLSRDG